MGVFGGVSISYLTGIQLVRDSRSNHYTNPTLVRQVDVADESIYM